MLFNSNIAFKVLIPLLILSLLSKVKAEVLHMKGTCIVDSYVPDPPAWDTDIRYLLQSPTAYNHPYAPVSFSFTFSPSTGDCATIVQNYKLTIDAGPPPGWITFNAGARTIDLSLASTDTTLDNRIYTGVIQGDLDTVAPMFNEGKYEFTITLSYDPCVMAKLPNMPPDDMEFMIKYNEPATVQTFNAHADVWDDTSLTRNCGPRLFLIEQNDALYITNLPVGSPTGTQEIDYNLGAPRDILLVTLDQTNRRLTVNTENPYLVGDHNITFTAQQNDYPQWNPVATRLYYFTISIDAFCHYSYFLFSAPAYTYILDASSTGASTQTIVNLQDFVSLTDSANFDGYTYCTKRLYYYDQARDVTKTYVDVDPTTQINIAMDFTNVGDPAGGTFAVTFSNNVHSFDEEWGTYNIDFYAGLEHYPGFGEKIAAVHATQGVQKLTFTVEVVPDCAASVITFDALETVVLAIGNSYTFTVVNSTYDKVDLYDGYCGDLVYFYEWVGQNQEDYISITDNLDGTFDIEIVTLYDSTTNAWTDADGTPKLYTVQSYLEDFPSVEESPELSLTLHKCPDGTANDFAKLTTIGGVTINEDTTTPYLYAIDDNDFNNGDGPEDFSFAFPVKNTVICEPLVDKEYYVKINGTEVDIATVNWAYFQDTDLTDVRFTIDSTESDETGTQTITIGSRITNVVDANGPLESDDEITFAVIMYASQCLKETITARDDFITKLGGGQELLTFEIDYLAATSQYPFDEFDITTAFRDDGMGTIEDCGDLKYTITGPAVDKKILTIDEPNRILKVYTEVPEFVGFHDATIWVEFENHPFLNNMKRISVDFQVEITAVCDDTTFVDNDSFVDQFIQAGTGSKWWQFENTKDTVTMATGNVIFDGWAYCKDRIYRISLITAFYENEQDSYVLLDPPIVQVLDEYLSFEISAPTNEYAGIHSIEVETKLYRYKEFPDANAHYQNFTVYVVPHCSSTTFITYENVLVDMHDIVVNQTSNRVQRAPTYFSDVSIQAWNWGYNDFSCGNLTYRLAMQNGSDVPDFIQLKKWNYDPSTGEYDYHYVQVTPNENWHNDTFAMSYIVGLETAEYQIDLKEHYDNFTIYVDAFPAFETNDLPIPKIWPQNYTLNVGEDVAWELWPFDNDDDEVTTQFKVLTTVNRAHCPECFWWDSSNLRLKFYAFKALQNTTTLFQVSYWDGTSYNLVTWHVTVEPYYELEVVEPTQPEEEETDKPEEIVTLTYGENMLANFTQTRCGYLLSGKVLPRRPSEEACLQQLLFPIAVVSQLDVEGNLRLSFNHDVVERENFYDLVHNQQLMKVYLVNTGENYKKEGFNDQVKNFDMSVFNKYKKENRDKIELEEASSTTPFSTTTRGATNGRMLATLTQDEYDAMVAADFELRKSDFNWTITEFTNEYMDIKLNFAEPDFISTYGFDQIEVLFVRTDGDQILKPNSFDGLTMLEVNYTTRGIIPPQFDPEDKSYGRLKMFGNAMFWIAVSLLILIMLMFSFAKDSLHYFWSYLNFMQLLVHLVTPSLIQPANADYLFKSLFPWGSYTSLLWGWKTGLYDYTGTPPFALNFDNLGYHARHTIVNIGTLNWVIVFAMGLFIFTVLLLALSRLIKSCRKLYDTMVRGQVLVTVWLRMFIQLYFVLLLCTFMTLAKPKDFQEYPGLIQLPQSILSAGDRLSRIQTMVTLCVYLVFTGIMFMILFNLRSYAKYKFAKLEALHATDVLFAFKSTRAEIIQKYARVEAAKGLTDKTLKERVKRILLKSEVLDSQLNLQNTANYNIKLMSQNNPEQRRLVQHLQNVKMQRMAHLAEARSRFELTRKNVSFWTSKWSRELRINLRQESALALAFYHIFMLRRALIIFCFLIMYDNPLYQCAFFTTVQFFQLVYLYYVRPFQSGLKNCMEIFNDSVIYLLGFMFIAITVSQALLDGSQFSQVGWYMCLIIEVAIVVNLLAIFMSLIEPFRIAMRTRSSTKLGRFLRFVLRRRLPTREQCTCDCCTCKEEAENPSPYPRSSFFYINPQKCTLLEPSDDEEYYSDDDGELSMIKEEDDGGLSHMSSHIDSERKIKSKKRPPQNRVEDELLDFEHSDEEEQKVDDTVNNSYDQKYFSYMRRDPTENASNSHDGAQRNSSTKPSGSAKTPATVQNQPDEQYYFNDDAPNMRPSGNPLQASNTINSHNSGSATGDNKSSTSTQERNTNAQSRDRRSRGGDQSLLYF